MYHKAINIQDLAFILDNFLDQHGEVKRYMVGKLDPTEVVDIKAYFHRNYPFYPADVTMFENTVCGDCGFVIHSGTCACLDRSLDVDTRYCITAKYFWGDAHYTITSKDRKEFFAIEIPSMWEMHGKNNGRPMNEEECFHIFYTILREAAFITEKDFNRTDEELQQLQEIEETDLSGIK